MKKAILLLNMGGPSNLNEVELFLRNMFADGKSPLLEITNSLSTKVSQLTNTPTYPVMRYVPPFAKEILSKLQKDNIEELILFPMYPHHSSTTTTSSIEDIKDTLKKLNYNPKLKIIDSYHNNKEYIKIQAN